MTAPSSPELLAPAGTKEALEAAIRAGADAVYFGGSRFNARMSADNFAGDAMGDAIRLCAFYGVKSNITLNTLTYEKEEADVLRYAEQLCRWGADAVICADLGIASLLHRYLPELPLHASTQCTGHSVEAARFFAELGFSRMVCARELSFADLRTICTSSPIETELFIHGAICVSQSGGCLFSSLVGGRSGNRGACAQPCRLPCHMQGMTDGKPHAKKQNGKKQAAGDSYPLSLRDMCLAGHIPELLSLGASSFKIEGRMKSPAYVTGVVSIYRRLIDERRNASPEETAQLAALFSRGGSFTDGYFRAKPGRAMQGTRTEADKSATAAAEKKVLSGRQEPRRIPAALFCEIAENQPITLTMTAKAADGCDRAVTVSGPVPEKAVSHPLMQADVTQNLAKLGATPFSASSVEVTLTDGLSLPLSALNALRREASSRLEETLRAVRPYPERTAHEPVFTNALLKTLVHPAEPLSAPYPYAGQALFLSAAQVPEKAASFYDIRYLPLETLAKDPAAAKKAGINGAVLPPVIFDSETAGLRRLLETAKAQGIRHLLISNPGQIAVAKETGMLLHGSFRLNVYSADSADVFARAGLCDILLSPELTLPQMRDIHPKAAKGAVTYGRLPLMTLQRCIIREAAGVPDGKACSYCDSHPFSNLSDRTDTVFPVTRAYPHRNILWNSAPLFMADKAEALKAAGLAFTFHCFTTESKELCESIIRAYETGSACPGIRTFRRIHT